MLTRLVDAASTATSTPALKLQALDYVPDDVDPPSIYPNTVKTEFDKTMRRATDKLVVTLRLLCARTDDRSGQHMLYGYMAGSGASSIKAAIEAQRGAPGSAALGGACDELHVTQIGEARWYEVAGERYVGCDFTVEIWGDGA